jgi:hypothetical protein
MYLLIFLDARSENGRKTGSNARRGLNTPSSRGCCQQVQLNLSGPRDLPGGILALTAGKEWEKLSSGSQFGEIVVHDIGIAGIILEIVLW